MPKVKVKAPSIRGWVITRDDGVYIGEGVHQGGFFLGWVNEKEKAMRFARRDDAFAAQRICYHAGVVFMSDSWNVRKYAAIIQRPLSEVL